MSGVATRSVLDPTCYGPSQQAQAATPTKKAPAAATKMGRRPAPAARKARKSRSPASRGGSPATPRGGRRADLRLLQRPVTEDIVFLVALGACLSLWGPEVAASVRSALLGSSGAHDLPAGLWLSAGFSYGFQLVNYGLSRFGVTDNFTGIVEFLPAALISFQRAGGLESAHPRQALLTAMLAAWSVRLGAFLSYRMVVRPGPDGRMDKLRSQRGVIKVGLLAFWLVHGSWGFVVSLPVTLGNALGGGGAAASHAGHTPLNGYDAAGAVLWCAGWLLEAGADQIKLRAHLSGDKTRYYELGRLWSWTRHPNFSGEVLCWLGVAVAASNLGGGGGAAGEAGTAAASSAAASGGGGLIMSRHWLLWRLLPWASLLLTTVLMLFEAVLLGEWKNNARFGKRKA
jgi:steroid 5-alpha reductase family enzyme